MSEWTSGYVSDIGYTYGYYTELNPLRSKLGLLNAGVRFPEIETACELGFGQGLSVNLHAAASTTEWWGTDFNPAQAGFAQELATVCQSGAKLFDESFKEFCARTDLPNFDYIGLHGIWSWVSDENRKLIVDFVRRKLRVGGILYMSYNTLPGWASFAPMRHLMSQHAEIIGSEGRGIVNRIDEALEFADGLLSTNPIFKRANPLIEDRLGKMMEQNRHYLAHEYFNKDWHPMHFATLAGWLDPAKVDFACSAHFLDQFDSVNLTDEQRKFISDIPDIMLQQSVRDFMVNQQFRRDYWVKGLRRFSTLERAENLSAVEIVLTTSRSDVSLKVSSALGEATMNKEIYGPIIEALSAHKITTIGQVLKEVISQNKGLNFSTVIEAIMILASSGYVVPVNPERSVKKLKPKTDAINKHLAHRARSSGETHYMASPVTGGGIMVKRFQQLFLDAIWRGLESPEHLAQDAWAILSRQGQSIIKDGQTLQSEDENLAELVAQATEFEEKKLPILRALKIA